MDNFDFLSEKGIHSPVLSPTATADFSQNNPNQSSSPSPQYNGNNNGNYLQQRQNQQQQGYHNFDMNFNMNSLDQFVENLIQDPHSNNGNGNGNTFSGSGSDNIHGFNNHNSHNVDDSPYGGAANFDYNLNTTNSNSNNNNNNGHRPTTSISGGSGLTPNFKVEDEYGLAIDNSLGLNMDQSQSNSTYNNNNISGGGNGVIGTTTAAYDSSSAVASPSAIAPSFSNMTNSNTDRRSASISANSNGNNNNIGHHHASASISGQPISTTGFNPSYFSPSIKPTPIQQRAGSVGAVNFSKSYGGQGQLGTSLTNITSPASTYDGFLDSPYGSYTGNSFTDSYLKSPMNSPSFKTLGSPASYSGPGALGTTPGGSISHVNPKNALSKENKLSRRRELHNAVERRRRDLIKEKIKELSSLIPPPLLNDLNKNKNNGSTTGGAGTQKEIKVNKSVTLTKGVEYIGYLKQILVEQDDRLLLLQSKIDELEKLEQPSTNNTNEDGQFGQQQQQQVSSTTTSQSPQLQSQQLNPNLNESNISSNVININPNHPNTNTNSNNNRGLEMEISNDLYDFLNEDNNVNGFGKSGGGGSGNIRNGGAGAGGDNFLQDLISKSGGAGSAGNGGGSDGW
ncbi:unnamed protein product [Ambrosiozyma monospora]|uniref:Unnamed protein product n=1 Tax=Ambrosiozyma monospora TaxID=43982 RepID=A0ACB5T6I6_AMBMO|nr:unnamed protein product [Ambrosiozyma monospora]